jgi:biopolymer transport protein ExbB
MAVELFFYFQNRLGQLLVAVLKIKKSGNEQPDPTFFREGHAQMIFLKIKLIYFKDMIATFSLQVDSLATAAAGLNLEKIAPNTEISVLEFIFKGGFFLIPIGILLFYTFYVIFERLFYINKVSKIDKNLLRDIKDPIRLGNLDLAYNIASRVNTASGKIVCEGILTIGRPISEIESNMERAANIEIGQMEHKLGQLGLIAGIAPTLGFIGTIGGVIKIFYSISVTENISIGNISGGLYEKMISSGSGLIVGIVAYSAYHLFNGKIDAFSLEVQRQILEFVNLIQRPDVKAK